MYILRNFYQLPGNCLLSRNRRLSITVFLLVFMAGCSTSPAPTYQLATTSSPPEGGTVSPASGEYSEGEQVQLTATANDQWVFAGWSGSTAGSQNPLTVTMSSDRNVVALFEKKEYPLTVETEGEGVVLEQIIPQKTTDYDHGSVVQLTATANNGWEFLEWRGDLTGVGNPETVTVTEAKTVTAVFRRVEFTINSSVEGNGAIGLSPEKEVYRLDEEVTITAEPADGWEFAGWQGDLDGDENPVTLTVTDDLNFSALFQRKQFNLNVSVDGNGTVEEEIVQQARATTHPYETEVRLTAVPDDGWEFDGWEGDASGSENPLTVTIDRNLDLTAVFTEIEPELQIWECARFFGCDSSLDSPEQTGFTWLGGINIIATTSSTVTAGRFFLRAIGKSYTITNVSATDRNGVTFAEFSGLENGTVVSPGEDVEFSLISGKTGGAQADLIYRFDVKGEDLSFRATLILISS